MSEYILVLIWLAVAGLISIEIPKQKMKFGDKIEYRYPIWWAIIIMLPIIYWVGTREYIGDTYVYAGNFQSMPQQVGEIATYMSGITKDKGFSFFSVLIKIFITSDKTIYFCILAAIQGIILVRLYRKYSLGYVTSIFLFIASTDYISWMYNGIRQFTAVTITVLAFEWVLKKKYMQAILIILLASLFHKSALIMLPFIFICQGKAWNKKTLLFIGIIIIAVAGIEKFTGVLDTVLAETQYKNVVSDWQSFQDDGTNILRVLVYIVPTILAFLGRKKINRENDTIISYCVNMSLISAGFYIVSIFTSGIFIGRIPIYFSLYNYILLPWEIKNIFEKRSVIMMRICMILGYLAFYYYSMHCSWNFI